MFRDFGDFSNKQYGKNDALTSEPSHVMREPNFSHSFDCINPPKSCTEALASKQHQQNTRDIPKLDGKM